MVLSNILLAMERTVVAVSEGDVSEYSKSAKTPNKSGGKFAPTNPSRGKKNLVSAEGFEPSTHALKGHCSTN
jgi:hypothetical protein